VHNYKTHTVTPRRGTKHNLTHSDTSPRHIPPLLTHRMPLASQSLSVPDRQIVHSGHTPRRSSKHTLTHSHVPSTHPSPAHTPYTTRLTTSVGLGSTDGTLCVHTHHDTVPNTLSHTFSRPLDPSLTCPHTVCHSPHHLCRSRIDRRYILCTHSHTYSHTLHFTNSHVNSHNLYINTRTHTLSLEHSPTSHTHI
jgi:hypothetical protein